MISSCCADYFKEILAGINLHLRPGDIYGLIGPNGAGKSTTIFALLGLRARESGRVSVLGGDPLDDAVSIRGSVGVMPEKAGFYDWMDATDYLKWYGCLYGSAPTDRDLGVDRTGRVVGNATAQMDHPSSPSGEHLPRRIILWFPQREPDHECHFLWISRDPARQETGWEMAMGIVFRRDADCGCHRHLQALSRCALAFRCVGVFFIRTSWASLISIAYLKGPVERVPRRLLGVKVILVIGFLGGWHVIHSHEIDLAFYSPRHKAKIISFEKLQTDGWRDLPAWRIDMAGKREQPLAIQWWGGQKLSYQFMKCSSV
jgi:energy-coupling factor transporter ATP-binding protein EcfA2